MPPILQRTLDSRVTQLGLSVAIRITRRRIRVVREVGRSAAGRKSLPGDQVSVPSENRVGCHERGELVQPVAAEAVSQHRQTWPCRSSSWSRRQPSCNFTARFSPRR